MSMKRLESVDMVAVSTCRASMLWMLAGTVIILSIFATSGVATAAATLRVDPDGTDSAGCGSESTPCKTIQQAVNESSSGDTILVAAGTYTHDVSIDPCPDYDTGVVCVKNTALTIIGGYAGGDWINADPDTNLTVIDGENASRGVLVKGGVTWTTLVMEGFTVTNGLGTPVYNDDNGFGGGLSSMKADITLRDMKFISNKAIGRAEASGSGGTGAGGGVAIRTDGTALAQVIFDNVLFDDNVAQGATGGDTGGYGQGGGIYINNSAATGYDLVFTNNQAIGADSSGAGSSPHPADAQGGAVAFKENSNCYFERITATNNSAIGGSATSQGGSSFGGALFGEEATGYTIVDGYIADNSSYGGDGATAGGGYGGGTMALNSNVTLDRTVVINNTAVGGYGTTLKGSAGGGAGYYSDSVGAQSGRTITIRNSILADNYLALGGGGGAMGGGGGAVFLNGSKAVLEHVTMANNVLATSPLQGRAIVIITRLGTIPSSMSLKYSIVAGHDTTAGDAAISVQSGSSISLVTSLFANNITDFNCGGTCTGYPAQVVYAGSAGFVVPGSDYHITESSAAKDAASGSSMVLDIDAGTRDANPDLGADEVGAGLVQLTVSKAGAGEGTVTSNPQGIDCGGDCSERYDENTVVTLTPVEGEYSAFVEWQGTGCTNGVVTMDGDKTCTAVFDSYLIFTDDFESGSTSAWSVAIQ